MGQQPERVWVFCDGSTGALSPDGGGISLAGKDGIPPSALGCGAGAVARADDGRILAWDWCVLPAMSNNEAEYAGLLLGLGLAQQLRPQEAIFVMDSEVVVGQMSGRFAVNSHALRPWHWKACEAARALPRVSYRVIPREWNRLADGLACQAAIRWEWLWAEVARAERGGRREK